MKANRKELLTALAKLKPAIGEKGAILEFSHIWFMGSHVFANNGGLGIRLDLETDLVVGVPGAQLLGLLATSSVNDVVLEQDDATLLLKMGRSRSNLATMCVEEDVDNWRFPTEVPKKHPTKLKLTGELLEAIDKLGFVKISKPREAVHNGVTLIPEKGGLGLYATDSATLAYVKLKDVVPKGMPRVILPFEFVKQISSLAEEGDALYVFEDCLLVVGNGYMIGSNLLELPDKPDLRSVLRDLLGDGERYTLPSGFSAAFERATILAGRQEALVTVRAQSGDKGPVLQVTGKFEAGKLRERMSLKDEHPEVEAKFVAERVTRAMSYVDHFALRSKALVLYGWDGFVYLVAAR